MHVYFLMFFILSFFFHILARPQELSLSITFFNDVAPVFSIQLLNIYFYSVLSLSIWYHVSNLFYISPFYFNLFHWTLSGHHCLFVLNKLQNILYQYFKIAQDVLHVSSFHLSLLT